MIQANSLNIPLKDESVQCVVTSPAYWGLRDYGTATWEGGKDGCDHKPAAQKPGSKSESNAGSTRSKPFTDSCGKCGAKRIDNQLGLEKTPEEYIENTVTWAREIWRVLRNDGTFWLNLGDSMWGGKGQSGQGSPEYHAARTDSPLTKPQSNIAGHGKIRPQDGKHATIKPKDLCMIPARVALALQNDGWYLRSAMPWVKRSAMPESCTDRPASALEYMFLLTKSGTSQYWTNPRLGGARQQPKPDYIWKHKETGEQLDDDPQDDENYKRINLWQGHDYFFDNDAIRVGYTKPLNRYGGDKKKTSENLQDGSYYASAHRDRDMRPNENGRNFRNTDLFYQSLEEPHGAIFAGEEMVGLDVNPYSYKEAHFATFPPKLVEPCIKAGSSEKGACPECWAPWERVVEKPKPPPEVYAKNRNTDESISRMARNDNGEKVSHGQKLQDWLNAHPSKTVGWQPTCECGHKETVPCIVLDNFAGSFTTKSVAQKLGRRGVGLELKWEYIQMGKKRCNSEQEDMFIPS